jgi:NAD(P)-dependent dehydrogenase (short-subunit alcohol dehydrogenase family)
MQALNLRTTLLASWATLPYLLTSGQAAPGRAAIVNVAAAAGLKAGAGMGAYAAAKSGVMRLTEAMADEFKARGLRVNAVLPGVIDTAANRAEVPEADFTRWVRPHEVAEVVAFLASPAASGLTGALLPVTGRV